MKRREKFTKNLGIHLLVLFLGIMANVVAQPTGALNGVFTVNSNGDKVYFSKGNLQFQPSSNTWRFANNQWNYTYTCGMNSSTEEWIDLFGWGTSGYNHGAACYQPWSTSQDDEDYAVYGNCYYNLYNQTGKADWGYNAISNGGNTENSGWRTLTNNEWNYILFNRSTSSGIRFVKAEVNDVNGLILLPDNWSTSYYTLYDINEAGADYEVNYISVNNWNSALQSHGAVFLPAAGMRTGTTFKRGGVRGFYMSSSRYDDYEDYHLFFSDAEVECADYSRYRGHSVRLVCTAVTSFTINVSASPSNGGSVSGGGTYDQGSTCTLTATPSTGYSFVRWTKNGSQVSTSATYSFTVSESATYTAVFSLNSYSISASSSPSSGGSVSGAGTYTHGSNCTLTATPATGYSFSKWTKNGSQVSTNASYSFTVTAAASYVAVFTQNSYSISATASPSSGGSVSGAGTYNYGSSCTLTATPATGYSFSKWTKNGSQVSTNASYSFTVTAAASYVAVFTQNSYTVSASASPSSGGSVSGAGTYTHGSNCTLTATPATGYSFSKWTKNGSQVSTNASYSFTVTAAASYVAVFTQNSYTISASASPSAGGSVSGAGTYNHGANCTLTATPATGYTFSKWTKNGSQVSTNASYSFTVTGNANYVANFAVIPPSYHWEVNTSQYPSNATAVGIIKIDGVEQTVTTLELGVFCGTECRGREKPTYVAQLNRYLLFLTYYGNDGDVLSFRLYDHSTNQEIDLPCSNTITFATNGTNGTPTDPYAFNFDSAPITFTIAATANPANGGTITGAGTYNQGSNCSLTATANSGYTFTNWTEGSTVVSTNATYSFTVTGDRTLVANFESSGPITNHWTPQSAAYSDNMGVTAVIQIEGVEQQSDMLEVGAFCGDECRGSAIATLFALTQRYIISMTVYGETGHQLTFKLFDHAIGEELDLRSPAEMAFVVDGYGSPIVPYVLNFTSPMQTQTTPLVSGWNWYSTYIEQDGIDGLAMLENSMGVNGVRIQSRNSYTEQFEYQGMYYWYGTLNSITNEQMYKVRTNAACDAAMEGYLAVPSDHPITISQGWNWIGYPMDESVSVTNALSGFAPEADDMIKGRNGYSTYLVYGTSTFWYGTLENLEPGKGYMYKSNSTTAKTLTFQTGSKVEGTAISIPENNVYSPNDVEYADNMTVTAVVEIEGEELRSEEYELAAFVGDECRGSVRLMYVDPIDRYVAFLTVFGEDAEEIRFVLTNGTDTRWSDDRLVYSSDATVGALSQPSTIHFGTLGVDEDSRVHALVYPNPSNDVFNIQCAGIRKIEVVNAYGQIIMTREVEGDFQQVDLSDKAAGIYMLHIVTDHGTAMKNIIKNN